MRRPHTTVVRGLGLAGAVVMVCAGAASPAALSLSVVSVTTHVARGTSGHLVVRTVPNARCGASVQAQADSGRTIASLPPQTAGSDGLITFSVHVPAVARPGPYPVTVSCRRGAKAAVAHLRVTVR